MQACDFENFDITIRGAEPPYRVSARYREQTADGEFQHAITQPRWQELARALRSTLYTPNPAPLHEAGVTLFAALFQGDIRDLWIAARSGLEQNRIQGLRIRLALQPPAVAALPWETLRDPHRSAWLAHSNRLALVRVEQEYKHLAAPAPLAVELPLRVLVAAPEDPDKVIDAKREIEAVKRMLNTLGRNQIEIRTMHGRFSIMQLRRRLEKVRPHVLHILTHGGAQRIQLWQNGRARQATAGAMQTMLERTPWVRFVFLNACLAGQTTLDRPLGALGSQLLQAGVPAVLAMQFEIRDDVAADFAHFLYESLLTEPCIGAIDAAVTTARAWLYALNEDQAGFATPVLWLNAPNGQLFTFSPALATPDQDENGGDLDEDEHDGSTEDSPPDTPPIAPPSPVDTIDVARETEWLAELTASVADLRVAPELEFALAALHTTLQTLKDLLDRLRNWDHTSRVQAYAEQILAYRRHKAEALRLRRKLREAL